MTRDRCGRRHCRCALPDESPTAPHGFDGSTVYVDAVEVRCKCGERLIAKSTQGGMMTALGMLTLHRARRQYAARALAADAGNVIVGLAVALAWSAVFWAVMVACYLIGQR